MHTEVNFGIRGRYKIRTCDPFRVREVRYLCANRPGLRADRPNRFSQPNLRADNGTRTRGLNLGKVALYQLSYVRKGIRREKRNPVGDVGIEPTTPSV